ncbi:serine/threonine protein kinase [Micromonospora coriariae]|uniref:non-specific serine/threonine protein kinase n=1 Tax=Micromonospora coriariae TaxID=285665 RepID=A0A1C4W120_9ACTN|nr:serine/threonine protein kinase [Micromonospora coriariae]
MQRDQLLAGRYRLLERLGSGGMSAVHRAYDEVLERDVAVKVLVASDVNARRRIRAEAKAAARLSHPHVTSVYDYGESRLDGAHVPFVVMELLGGHTLEQRLDAGPLPPRAGLRVCAEVAAALAAAHAQELVHRDIKPGNVMLTPTGAKVLDFGIAAAVGDPEFDFEGRLLGTPAYLAPERLEGGEVLPACDVYALGLLVHRVLTGRPPDAPRVPAHVEPDPLPEIVGVPAEIHRLYRWCLARDPADRPPAAEAARILYAAGERTAVRSESAAGSEAGGEPAANERTATAVAGRPDSDARPPAVAALSTRPAEPVPGAAAGTTGAARRRSWRWRRAVLAVGGAVVATLAMGGSLGDPGTRRQEADAPRTGIGPGGATTVAMPRTAEPPGPADPRPPAAPPASATSSGAPTSTPTGPGGTRIPSPTAPPAGPTPTTAAPTPAPPPGMPVDAQGGTVTVRCLGASAEVLAVAPAPGYRAEAYDPGPAKRIEVELTSGEHRSEIRVHCANGRPKPNVKERAEDRGPRPRQDVVDGHRRQVAAPLPDNRPRGRTEHTGSAAPPSARRMWFAAMIPVDAERSISALGKSVTIPSPAR